eukprot:gene1808-950_t
MSEEEKSKEVKIIQKNEEETIEKQEGEYDYQHELNNQIKAQIIYLNDLNAEMQTETQWTKMRMETLTSLYSQLNKPPTEVFNICEGKFSIKAQEGKWTDVEKVVGKLDVVASRKYQYSLYVSGHSVKSDKPLKVSFRFVVKNKSLENVTLFYPNEQGTRRLISNQPFHELVFTHVADFCEGINNFQLQVKLDGEFEWNSEYGEIYLYMK